MAAPTVISATASSPRPGSVRGTATGVIPVDLLGLGAVLPRCTITNEDLAGRFDTSDAWIRSRTGIGTRHAIGPGESTATLATDAARRALTAAEVSPADLDAVLVATTTPDHRIPATAPSVAAALGTQAPATDLNAACSGFVVGLQMATGLLATGARRVLVIGAETLTRVVDPADRTTAVLFGDGAGAVVLGAGARGGTLGPFDVGSDGRHTQLLWVADDTGWLTMRGREVYRHAVARMSASSLAVLDRAGLTTDDVDLLVGHQANARILHAVASRVDIGLDRCHLTVAEHGNTSAASIPLALADAADAGRLRPGRRILLTAFGAGFTWASCLLTLPEEPR